MKTLNEFLSYKFFDGEIHLSGYRLILLVCLVIFSVLIYQRAKKKLVIENKMFKNSEKKKTAFNAFRIIFFVAFLILTLNILNIPIRSSFLNEYLKIQFLKLGQFQLSGYNIIVIILLYFITNLLLKFVRSYFFDRNRLPNITDQGRKEALFTILKYFVWVFVAFIMLDTVGITLQYLKVGSAVFLGAIAFGLKDLFMDFVAGVIILFDGSIEVGDIVQLDNLTGKVKKINIRTTELETLDQFDIIVPNSKFIGDNVINWSHSHNPSRFNVKVGVAYGSDVRKVKEILLECARRHSQVVDHPSSTVQLNDFGDSSLVFELFFWSDNIFEITKVKSDLRFMIEDQFREKNVRIPFPQRDVHTYVASENPSDSQID